jgi:hypothetical protein
LPFAIFIGAILAVGLVALLLLHTMAAQDAFRLQALQRAAGALDDTEQQLAVATEQQESPTVLGARARGLGMVPTGSIAYVDLHHHGKVVGVVQTAAPPPPPPAPSPSATAKAKPSAKASAKPTGQASSTTHKHPARKPAGHHSHQRR